MTALVGQFAPDGRWYRARPVDLEGQPSWLLGQLWSMWARKYRRDAGALCAALLRHDWSVLANTAWPSRLVDEHPARWQYVNGVGRAHPSATNGHCLTGRMPADAPRAGGRWAYLWEHAGGALHVYVVAAGRWHHIATLPVEVFAALTPRLILDIEARQDWPERAA